MFKWVDFCNLWGYICKLLFNGCKGKEKDKSLDALAGLAGSA